MPDSFDVFISYKREDQAFAETLREKLIAWGYSTWMDKYNIPAGAYWPDEIDRGLKSSQVVIGLLSPRAIASRNVKNEWDWSIVNGKRLLLLMIEPCVVPMNYVSINYIDCVKDQAAGQARLHSALTSPIPPPPTVDSYHDYLQALYDRINTYLAQKIIKVRPDDPRTPEPIQLRSERTRGAVDALFEKRDEIDPLFMIGGIKQEPTKLDGDFRSAFDYFDGRVLLLGEPGAGKTITLLHFGRDAVVQRIQDPAKPLPVLAIIPTWGAEKQTLLTEWLANAYGAPPDVARIVAEGRALLLLDGLDELGSTRENPETKERYDPRQRFMAIIPANNQVIVTCRVKDYEEIGEKIALKGAVTLKQLTDEQIRDYLSAEVPDLWAALEADEELRDVARTPLLLSLFAFGYKDQGEEAAKLRDLRESPGELRDAIFKQYIIRRYEHEARKLQIRQPPELLPFTLDEVYNVLGHAAMANVADWEAEANVVTREHFVLPDKRLCVFTELAMHLNLLIPEEQDTFRFVHPVLRDHFGFLYTLPRLSKSNKRFRWRAAEVLGQIGDARAVEPLIATLRDADVNVRRSVVAALGKIKDARAVEPLAASLHDSDEEVRTLAVVALEKIGDVRAAGPLIVALQDKQWEVRFLAALALREMGEAVAEVLITALHNPVVDGRHHIAEALGRIGNTRAVMPLIAALRDPDAEVRDSAVNALGKLGDARAVKPLIAALRDPDIFVRASATTALGKIEDTHAVGPLKQLLSDTSTPEGWWKRICDCAAEALERIGTPEALAALKVWRREQNEK